MILKIHVFHAALALIHLPKEAQSQYQYNFPQHAVATASFKLNETVKETAGDTPSTANSERRSHA